MHSPIVSVLMPAYNSEKYIADAIDSILNQTFQDFELIVIDDCSKDKTWHIIQKYAQKDKRVVAIKNTKNLGISDNRNKAISISKGKYLAPLDNDDWSYPDRFAKQVEFLDNNPDIGIVGGSVEVYNETFTKLLYKNTFYPDDKSLKKHIFRQLPFSHSSVMYRREIGLENPYSNKLCTAEDYDFYFRAGIKHKFANLKDVLIKYRTSKTQESTTKNRRQSYLAMYIRLKATVEYGYKLFKKDIALIVLKLILIPTFPKRFRDQLFNMFWKGPNIQNKE
jgi:glycosyltransferase involved in cell wall biosynthesis